MAKNKPLIDLETMKRIVLHENLNEDAIHDHFVNLAKAAKKSGAGCVSMTMRFNDGLPNDGVGGGEYIPELMLRVRKP